jgi:hypothetical protein
MESFDEEMLGSGLRKESPSRKHFAMIASDVCQHSTETESDTDVIKNPYYHPSLVRK